MSTSMVALHLAEPDVALTDLLLAVECAIFVALLRRRAAHRLRTCFVGVFSCIGVASLLGALVHGPVAPTSVVYGPMWSSTLVALVAMASFVWTAGAHLLLAPSCSRQVLVFAVVAFIVASSFVLLVDASFWVVVTTYFPSVVWLAVGYAAEMRRRRACGRLLIGFVGLLLTLVAAGIQQARVPLHAKYFDHNALYHAVQALALLFVFVSTRSLLPSQHGKE